MPQDEISFTDFIASSIHDMKNSLMMQVHALESVAAECRQKGDQETVQKLGGVLYEASRMNSSLIQLLGIYKFDKAIYPMDVVEHSLADVIAEAVMQNTSNLNFKGLKVTTQCDPDLYWYFDRDLVSGMLLNALNNAYNYTKSSIHIVARQVDGMLELRVEDDGRGYPASMLSNSSMDANKGIHFSNGSTGLGFHFVSRAARMHKNGGTCGSLAIENGGQWGGGCFIVRLP